MMPARMSIAYARMGKTPMYQTDCPGLGMEAIICDPCWTRSTRGALDRSDQGSGARQGLGDVLALELDGGRAVDPSLLARGLHIGDVLGVLMRGGALLPGRQRGAGDPGSMGEGRELGVGVADTLRWLSREHRTMVVQELTRIGRTRCRVGGPGRGVILEVGVQEGQDMDDQLDLTGVGQ